MFIDQMVSTARGRLVVVSDDAPLIEAARLLGMSNTDLLVVCGSDGRLSGVITKTDVVRQLSRCQGSSCTVVVSTKMADNVVFCRSTDQVSDIWANMKERRLKNIPAIDEASVPIGRLRLTRLGSAFRNSLSGSSQLTLHPDGAEFAAELQL